LGYLAARVEGLRLREQDSLCFVGFDLPLVGRMRFTNIDDEEVYLIAEATMQFFQVPNLGTEGRSSITSEDQGYRFTPPKRRELNLLVTTEARQSEIRRVRTDRRGQRLALGKKLHHRRAPLGFHPANEGHHPIEVAFGQMLSQ